MSGRQRAALLVSWALESGFDRAGVARLAPAAGGSTLLEWLERGRQAGMAWMGRRLALRLDPRAVLPGARSALCVALHYGPSAPAPAAADLWNGVARYARGRDYHNLMGKKLRRLARRIGEAFPGAATRTYVDTGPILERELAAAAGLGAVGKNTMLLHPQAGSFFLLGELLTSLDLEPGETLADQCGSCTRCLEACPTGALESAFRLDARRCISYWTIEHRGVLPATVRELLGEWVFGCDACQEVCPWNGGELPPGHPDLDLPAARGALDLPGLAELDEAGYRRLFHGSPMQRAGLRGLRRNAVVAMGNSRREVYVEPLGRLLREASADLRRHAAWALGRIGGAAARQALQRAETLEGDVRVGSEIRDALARSLGQQGSSEPFGGAAKATAERRKT